MALEKTFREFSTQLQKLRDRLQELQVTVVEDRPAKNDAVIVDSLDYAVTDLLGWLNETVEAARTAEAAVGQRFDLGQARRSLTLCQERFRLVEQGFAANLVSYEKVKDLTSFGKERRGEWPSWVTSAKQGIEQCRPPLEDAGKALAECWQDLAERAGGVNVSVNTTTVGQRVTAAVREKKGAAREETA